MTDDFAKAKRRVSDKFLGKSAVHGVGIHAGVKDTIAVYRERAKDESSAETEAIAESIRQEASPFNVEIVHEEGAAIHTAPDAADEGLGIAVPRVQPTSPDKDESLSGGIAKPEQDGLSENRRRSGNLKADEAPNGDSAAKEWRRQAFSR